MAKSSARGAKQAPERVTSTKVMSGRVTKPTKGSSLKSKITAAKVVAIKETVDRKQKHKVPEPESESESEESENSDSSDEETDASENESRGSAEEESESESEEERVAATKPTKQLANGKAKPAVPESSDEDSADEDSESASEDATSDESSDDGSDSEGSSSDDSEDEKSEPMKTTANGDLKKTAAKPINGKANMVKAKAKNDTSGSEDSSDDNSEDNESEDDESELAEDSSDDSSDSAEESDKEESKPAAPSKKRKAEAEAGAEDKNDSVLKKSKTSAVLFAGNLSWNVDDDWLAKEFRSCEGFLGARVVYSQGRSKGFGYVDFSTPEAAQAAIESMADAEIDGRKVNLDFSAPRSDDRQPTARAFDRAKERGDTLSAESDTLFVGNLPFSVDEDVISSHFNEVATVSSLRLPTDRETGNRKGFGYVSFASIEDAKSALNQLNGSYIGGRAIRLDFSGPRASQAGGNRGGRGGSRGAGRGGRGGGRGGGFHGARSQGMQAGQGKKTTFD